MVDLSICQLLKDNRNENKTKVIVENKGKYLQNFFMQWVQSFSLFFAYSNCGEVFTVK